MREVDPTENTPMSTPESMSHQEIVERIRELRTAAWRAGDEAYAAALRAQAEERAALQARCGSLGHIHTWGAQMLARTGCEICKHGSEPTRWQERD
jgi:hypothetical protein